MVFAFCLGGGRAGLAQEYATPVEQAVPVVPPENQVPLPVAPEPAEQTDEMNLRDQQLMEPENTQDTVPTDTTQQGYVFKKWRIIPYGSVQMTSDDNIFISAHNPKADVYFNLAAGVAVGWGAVQSNLTQSTGYFRQADTPKVETNPSEQGSFLYANYSGGETMYVHNSSQNSFNQDAGVAGQWIFGKSLFGANLRYQSLTSINIDVGGLVHDDITTAAATFRHSISDKTSIGADFSSVTNAYTTETALGSTDSSIQALLNYQATGKLSIGPGFKVGDLAVEKSPSHIYEQILLRGVYVATGKLTFAASGGLQANQINSYDYYDPVFTLDGVYTPSDQTTISLDAFRQTFSSASTAGEDIDTTAIGFKIRQRCFEKMYLALGGGYQNGKYIEVVQTSQSGRTDNSLDFQASISFDLTDRLTMQLAYEYRDNLSTEADAAFKQSLITLELDLVF